MITMDVKIQTDNIEKAKQAARENLQTALALLGQAAETNAVFEITVLGAVDTGNLRRNIEHGDDGKDTAYVGTNVEYGKYVEYGTSKMKPRPFLKQAIQNHQAEYRSLLEQAMKG